MKDSVVLCGVAAADGELGGHRGDFLVLHLQLHRNVGTNKRLGSLDGNAQRIHRMLPAQQSIVAGRASLTRLISCRMARPVNILHGMG